MATCLVIGGGLLGGAVARRLAAADHEVILFSRSFAFPLSVQSEFLPTRRITQVAGVIERDRRLSTLIANSDVVFYFAGGSTPAGADTDAAGSVALSVVPATTVMELMRRTSRRRIVLASSGGTVYGEPAQHPTSEDHSTDPIGIHGHNALTVERYATFYARRHGFEPVIFRIATAYGPGQITRRGQGVISAWIDAALAQAPLQVYGNTCTRRDLIFSDDVAVAAAKAAFEAAPGIYNVGSGVSHTLEHVVGMLGELAGRQLEVMHHPARTFDVHHTELDSSRLQREIGWTPHTTLSEGLRETWNWAVKLSRGSTVAVP